MAATSSIEQILMVDKVNGTPNLWAARQALISPSASCIPQKPVGARPTGMRYSWPTIVVFKDLLVMSTATFYLNLIPWKSVSFSWYVD